MASLAKIATLATTPSSWPALAKRIAPTLEHRAALASFDFETVLDVGANKGQFGYFAKMQWPTAQIHCFEPLPGPSGRLLDLLGGRVILHNCALGAENGTAEIHVASREDSSSLLPLSEAQKDMFNMNEAGTNMVPVRRLDEVIAPPLKHPCLLKIDVQGFEYEVLDGARALLPHIDAIYLEASFVELYVGQKLANQVTAFLEGRGFTAAGRFNDAHDETGNLVQADLLFLGAQ